MLLPTFQDSFCAFRNEMSKPTNRQTCDTVTDPVTDSVTDSVSPMHQAIRVNWKADLPGQGDAYLVGHRQLKNHKPS